MKISRTWWGVLLASITGLSAGWWWQQHTTTPRHKQAGALAGTTKPVAATVPSDAGPGSLKSGAKPALPAPPADSAIVPPPTSSIIKTVVDTTPRAADLIKVFRITSDPSGLAAEAFLGTGGGASPNGFDNGTMLMNAMRGAVGNNAPSSTVMAHSTLVVWPPVPSYEINPDNLNRNEFVSAAVAHDLRYFVEDTSTGKIVGSFEFDKNGKPPGGYKLGSSGMVNPPDIGLAQALRHLASLAIVQAGSYEPRIIFYGNYPSPGTGVAIWLRSPSGNADLVYPLPEPGLSHLPYGVEAKVYLVADFVQQLQVGQKTFANRAAGNR